VDTATRSVRHEIAARLGLHVFAADEEDALTGHGEPALGDRS
jgi:hypothetical protein